MLNDLMLARHFIAELLARRYQYERVPEPELVMDSADNVREFRDAGLVEGSVAPVYLFNMVLLCGAIRPGSVVVDLGCGPANLLVELALLHPQARFIGVDLSAEMLRLATDLRDSMGASNVTFVKTDITHIDGIEARSADLVMSTLSLHHLPERVMLTACVMEAARLLKSGGDIHLMDFGGLKRSATTEYFARERAKGLAPFLAMDYRNSLYAAYRAEDFEAVVHLARAASPQVRIRKTFGVPFLVALSSLRGDPTISVAQGLKLHHYWSRMQPPQRKDFDAMRYFFRLDGLRTPHPRGLASA